MKYGVVFPQTEIGSDPIAIRDWTQAVESMGFDYILAYDHVLGANPDRPGGWRGPYIHETMFHEVFTLFSYIAAITTRIELCTGILILPQRQTALVAKQAAEVDVLSGGRLRLGIGIGWNAVEYEALGENFNNRGKRSEEQIEVLRLLFTQELVTYQGKYHTISDAGLNPMPIQRPIPIWFGGGADIVLRRMAKMGDGWIANSMPLDSARRMTEQLQDYLRDENRAPSTFGIDIRVSVGRQTMDEMVETVEVWRALGATHAGLNTMGAGYKTLPQHIDAIRQYAVAFDVRG